jgi:methionyl-tRNA formyltransferase
MPGGIAEAFPLAASVLFFSFVPYPLPMKLIFMGTPEFAVPILGALLDAGHQILAVFTQPDRPVGRKQVITPPPIKAFARERDLRVEQPTKLRTPEARATIEPLLKEADATIVAAYGRILPGWMLSAPRLGSINVHSSILPKYRGAAPINWAIARGETETGVTIMQMDEGLDTGPMLLIERTPIGDQETAPELTVRLSQIGAKAIIEALARLERGDLPPIPQNDAAATLAPILKREDGEIDWNLRAEEILNRKRGFTPFPGCFTFLNGQRLEILRAEAEPSAAAATAPGTVLEVTRESFTVSCSGETQLRITELLPAGKRAMSTRDFLNGVHLTAGAQLGNAREQG